MRTPRGKLIFDDRCGLCQKATQLLLPLDWFGTIELIPLSRATELTKRYSIPIQAMEAAIHYISPLGQVATGAEAFQVFGKKIPLLLPFALVLHLPFALRLAKCVYAKVATRRHVLSRLLRCESSQCSTHRNN